MECKYCSAHFPDIAHQIPCPMNKINQLEAELAKVTAERDGARKMFASLTEDGAKIIATLTSENKRLREALNKCKKALLHTCDDICDGSANEVLICVRESLFTAEALDALDAALKDGGK